MGSTRTTLLGHRVWGLDWGVGWGKTPKPSPRVGLGWDVALGAWLSSRAWGGMNMLAGCLPFAHPSRHSGVFKF
ncbi:hypothetical protein HanIR_Chr15g0737871 [Helianthus annuus]|nr:hypothetical protein HanIR_Chr15g0737871 [Helianthus annuus]